MTTSASTPWMLSPKPGSKVDRTSYPEDAKAHYLKMKKLYIKKLKLASHIRETTSQLKEAKLPHVIDFKCAPLRLPYRMGLNRHLLQKRSHSTVP
jgi:hypothetical protein